MDLGHGIGHAVAEVELRRMAAPLPNRSKALAGGFDTSRRSKATVDTFGAIEQHVEERRRLARVLARQHQWRFKQSRPADDRLLAADRLGRRSAPRVRPARSPRSPTCRWRSLRQAVSSYRSLWSDVIPAIGACATLRRASAPSARRRRPAACGVSFVDVFWQPRRTCAAGPRAPTPRRGLPMSAWRARDASS